MLHDGVKNEVSRNIGSFARNWFWASYLWSWEKTKKAKTKTKIIVVPMEVRNLAEKKEASFDYSCVPIEKIILLVMSSICPITLIKNYIWHKMLYECQHFNVNTLRNSDDCLINTNGLSMNTPVRIETRNPNCPAEKKFKCANNEWKNAQNEAFSPMREFGFLFYLLRF